MKHRIVASAAIMLILSASYLTHLKLGVNSKESIILSVPQLVFCFGSILIGAFAALFLVGYGVAFLAQQIRFSRGGRRFRQ